MISSTALSAAAAARCAGVGFDGSSAQSAWFAGASSASGDQPLPPLGRTGASAMFPFFYAVTTARGRCVLRVTVRDFFFLLNAPLGLALSDYL